jgi:hypothetical protein
MIHHSSSSPAIATTCRLYGILLPITWTACCISLRNPKQQETSTAVLVFQP